MNNHDKIIKRIRNSAISYLARYEVSEFQFKNTMIRKLSSFENQLHEELKIEIVDQIQKEMIASGFIDDKRYAEMKSRSIRRQGGSERLIFAKLKHNGITDNIIKNAIEIVDEGNNNAEMIAAINFIRKKNIGVFYKKNFPEEELDQYLLKQKWIGSLSRRGFNLSIINKVINITDIKNTDLVLQDAI